MCSAYIIQQERHHRQPAALRCQKAVLRCSFIYIIFLKALVKASTAQFVRYCAPSKHTCSVKKLKGASDCFVATEGPSEVDKKTSRLNEFFARYTCLHGLQDPSLKILCSCKVLSPAKKPQSRTACSCARGCLVETVHMLALDLQAKQLQRPKATAQAHQVISILVQL